MRERPGMVIGNWKMHGSSARVGELLRQLLPLCEDAPAEAAVCPPAVYLPLAVELARGTRVAVGGQDCSPHPGGAHTGEVAASMLADVGCDRVIIGHSERRRHLGETSELAAAKSEAARAAGLVPVICVGETLRQRERGEAASALEGQLRALLPELRAGDVIAYEPVWAIGTGRSATPGQAQAMHAHIRGVVRHRLGEAADRMRLLYGGSVRADNAAGLFAQADIDGALVGGASLDAREFAAIVRAAGEA